MSQFINLSRHEFRMSIRRPGLWIAFGLLFLFFTSFMFISSPQGAMDADEVISMPDLWKYAGRFIIQFNLFFPVVVGILAADRMQRDFRLGVRELQNSTPLSRPVYILGKYLGVLASLFLPVFLWTIALAVALAAAGTVPWAMVYALPVVCLVMTVPAFAFVTAFSLACPLIMPLRVYQILFTGYWFWGNALNSDIFPTLNGTLLTPGGMFIYQGFFGGFPKSISVANQYTAVDATLNLLVLGLCILAVMVVLDRYLRWQAQRA
jgi:ABC-2 type transport system permease protein